MTNPNTITTLLRSARFNGGSEASLQEAIASLLAYHGIACEREVPLDSRSRIDILCGDCGIEVKIASSRMEVIRQLHRYSQFDSIESLILVTTKAQHASIAGDYEVPIQVVCIGGGL